MTGIIIAACVPLILTFIFMGFNLWTIGAIISTVMFCGRKIGYFCKFGHLVAIELITGFITVMFQLLFNRFDILEFCIVLLLRLIFLGIALYDKTVYVYFQEVRRREDEA